MIMVMWRQYHNILDVIQDNKQINPKQRIETETYITYIFGLAHVPSVDQLIQYRANLNWGFGCIKNKCCVSC